MLFTSSQIFQQQSKFDMYCSADDFAVNMVEVFGVYCFSKSQLRNLRSQKCNPVSDSLLEKKNPRLPYFVHKTPYENMFSSSAFVSRFCS